MIDWKKLAEDKSADLIKDVEELISVESVRDDSKKTDDAPVGPGPKEGLLKVVEYWNRDGFDNQNLKNIVGFAEYKTDESDDDYLAILGHVDVMPAGDGWNTDPFVPVIKDGKLYGRGSSDDKGPTLAAYYGLKIVRDLKLPLKHKIRFIVGTDEENDWTGMDHYFATQPKPAFGFSPDAEFPIINGEKGLGQFEAHFKPQNDGEIVLEDFTSGLRTNMVPGKATAIVLGSEDKLDQISEAFTRMIQDSSILSGGPQNHHGQLLLVLNGKQAHGAMPELGENAATYLANFLSQFEFNKDAKYFLNFVGQASHQDPEGKKVGIAIEDTVMGKLSYNIGILRFKNDRDGMINVNIRYPKGTDGEQIVNKLNQAIDPDWDAKFEILGHNQEPHYVAPSDPIVKTLLDIYHDQTGLEAHDQVIGGGTYGRLMERGVAYGALFPDAEDTMHQANEYMRVDDIIRSAAIYAEAIYKLSNLD
ncbi:MAG: dipeptidase PepV [Lactobacillaceae bacterium]|jgi:D-alanyl-D-alanine dipeptidase|nr:dipeptidase PepV [Lactobacillaceae bacterium]